MEEQEFWESYKNMFGSGLEPNLVLFYSFTQLGLERWIYQTLPIFFQG